MQAWMIVAVLALVLSPLVWMVPSRRQRGQMDMRLAARRLGLGMQVARKDWPHWLQPEPPHACAQYHWPRPAGLADWSYWQVAPGQWHNRWREPCAEPAHLVHLATLPTDVYQVEALGRMLALYWGEKGGEQELERVAAGMRALARL